MIGSLPAIEATEADSEALADIIWFIKGRMSVLEDQGRYCELDGNHLEALRRFRVSLPRMQELRHRAEVAEKRANLAEHYMSQPKKKAKK